MTLSYSCNLIRMHSLQGIRMHSLQGISLAKTFITATVSVEHCYITTPILLEAATPISSCTDPGRAKSS